MRTTTVTVPGNPRRYIDALEAGANALQDTQPDTARILADVARSIDQVRRQQVLVKAVARAHRPHRYGWSHTPWCDTCHTPWPCRTTDQLQRAGIHIDPPQETTDHPANA